VNPPSKTPDCPEPRFDASVTPYCFAELTGRDLQEFEAHLLVCDACWREVDRLSAAAAIAKMSPRVVSRLRTPQVIAELGISGRIDRPFAGHRAFVIIVALLYGLLHGASVWTELAYSYDRYAALTWSLSAGVFAWVTVGLAVSLWSSVKAARVGNERGLPLAALMAVGMLAIMTLAAWRVLPSIPTVDATFETRSAAAGFLKNELMYFIPLLLFILPTFHAVVVLQEQLRAGRFRGVFQLLTGRPESLAPRGVWLVPGWLLGIVLIAGALIGYTGTNNLLDNLERGPNANLFTAALYVRVFLWYGVALACLAWYYQSRQELKREAIASVRLTDNE
jgi:hypothetical protein